MHAYAVVSEERESVSVVFLRSLMPLASPSAIGALLFFVGLLVVATSCSNYQQRAQVVAPRDQQRELQWQRAYRRGPTASGNKENDRDRLTLLTHHSLRVGCRPNPRNIRVWRLGTRL